MKPSKKLLTLATVACALTVVTVLAQQKVQGVKWRAKVTMQSKTFTMPERMVDVCLPATEPDQGAIKQAQQSNCKMTSVKRSGNKTVADMKCTGDSPSESHWEMETQGDTMHGAMTTKTAANTINIKYDYTKVGGACEVQQAPAQGAMPQGTLEERRKKLQEMLGGK